LPAAITPNIIQTSRSKTLILIVAQLPSRSSRYKHLHRTKVNVRCWRILLKNSVLKLPC
jgi:hypothetical protein